MDAVQAWLLFGVPGLLLGLIFFMEHSAVRAALGYLSLLGGFVGLALVDRVSAAVFAGLIVLVYAAGRGGSAESVRGQEAATQERHRELGASGMR